VVDTNVVLDLLVFRDTACLRLQTWLEGQGFQWLACGSMRDELAHVLGRGLGERWPVEPATVVAEWNRRVKLTPVPPDCDLRCSDPDDQKFIDLSMAHQPCRLITRDRALLKLTRQAAERGVLIHRPVDLPFDPC
jgi:predicted nucleic acid-binding protein